MKRYLIILAFLPLFLSGQTGLGTFGSSVWTFQGGTTIFYGLPASYIDYFAFWYKGSQTSNYYIDKVGIQDRNSLNQEGITGITHTGKAIAFDSDKTQYSKTFGNRPSNFRLANNSLTLSFWIKKDSVESINNTNIFGTPSVTDGFMYGLINNITGVFTFTLRDSNADVILNSSSSVADSVWHHIFISLDKTGNAVMYIDNVIQGSPTSLIGSGFEDLDRPWFIGENGAGYGGTLHMRDYRLFSNAITSDSIRLRLYNQEYVSGATSWWMMEDNKEGSVYKISDCIDTNNLVNINFDATSISKGTWASLFNSFGYRANEYAGNDVFQSDGDFLDMTLWAYNIFASRWTAPDDGTITWNAIDDLATYMRNDRTINYFTGDVFKMTFDITSGTANFDLRNWPAGVITYPAADYTTGHHEVVFQMGTGGSMIQLNTNVASGVWTMENWTIEPYDSTYISPQMISDPPTTDIYDSLLIFKDIAKNNLFKHTGDSVYFTDSIHEIFEPANLISVNNWFDTTGASNKIKWADIQTQTGRQYFNGRELIIIKADVELTVAEDLVIKNYMNLPIAYNPFYYIDVAIGDSVGTTTQIYATQQAIIDGNETIISQSKEPSSQELNPEDDYIVVGWADFFNNDYNYTAPIARKYGFTNTFYRQIIPLSYDPLNTTYNRDKLKQIEQSGSYDANHGYTHFSYATSYPLGDGRTIPSNYNIRQERSDLTNSLGYDTDATMDASITAAIRENWLRLADSTGAKAWKDLLDIECDDYRKAQSVFGVKLDPQNGEQVLQSLDVLSERYCGTTGISVYDDYTTRTPNTTDGLEPSPSNKIVGGIFQGAATTQNHEVWERLLIISDEYKREFEGKINNELMWATPGGTSYTTMFAKLNELAGDGSFQDSTATLLSTGASQHTSTITNESRSFIELLQDYGYEITSNTQGDGYGDIDYDGSSLLESARMVKKNGTKKIDNVGDGYSNALRLWDHSIPLADQISLLDSVDMVKALYNYTFSEARYSGIEPTGAIPPYDKILNYISKYNAWGLAPDFIGDAGCSGDCIGSYTLVLEAVYQYCKRAGIKVISFEEGYKLSTNYSLPVDYNYFPNPAFKTTPKTITASSNAILYPDGWNDGTVVRSTDTSLYYNTNDTIFTRQYTINPGSYDFSFEGMGNATLKVRKIRNNDTLNSDSGALFDEISSITINSIGSYTTYNSTLTIPDNPLETYPAPSTPKEEAYQNYMQQYGNKICGIQIELIVTGGGEINLKNPSILLQ